MSLHLRIKHKLWLIAFLGLGGFLVSAVLSLWSDHDLMLQDRQARTRTVVEVGYAMLEHYGRLAESGKMTREQAQAATTAAIAAMRYEGNNYLTVYDTAYNMVLHPIKPEMNGKSMADLKDPNGVKIIVELVAAAQRAKGETVRYLWPKPGETEPVPKMASALFYAPWGWVISSGIYVDDINTAFKRRALVYAGFAAAGLLVMLLAVFFVTRSVTSPLHTLKSTMVAISGSGDLTRRVEAADDPDLAEIGDAFNALIDRLRGLLGNIVNATTQVSKSAQILAEASARVEAGTESQRTASASVASAIDQISASLRQVSDNVSGTLQVTSGLKEAAEAGQQVVSSAADEMTLIAKSIDESAVIIQELGKRSITIADVVTVIRDIADQTNLLALNAAIEAARAGDSGRGFAVVADEVRKLAERTTKSTAQISDIIGRVRDETATVVANIEQVSGRARHGATLARQADMAAQDLNRRSGDVVPLVSEISNAAREQTIATQEISRSVEEISRMADSNSEQIGSTADTVRHLREMISVLDREVAHFKV